MQCAPRLWLERPLFELEKIYDYKAGGRHPVHLGDLTPPAVQGAPQAGGARRLRHRVALLRRRPRCSPLPWAEDPHDRGVNARLLRSTHEQAHLP